METTIVPLALQDRLGPDGTLGFLEFTQANNTALRDDVLEVVTDRFERRLGVEVASLREQMAADRLATANEFAAVRQEMANGFASVRLEMANGSTALRQEMATGDAALRQAMATGDAALRQEMANGFTAVRKEMSDGRVELIKWSFLFWVGQIAVLSGIMALLMKSTSLR